MAVCDCERGCESLSGCVFLLNELIVLMYVCMYLFVSNRRQTSRYTVSHSIVEVLVITYLPLTRSVSLPTR